MEVNSTFYSPLQETVLRKWAKSLRGSGFSFSLKIPGNITHENLIQNTDMACSEMEKFQETHLDFLSQEGLLGAILFQLPPYFKLEHTDKLLRLIGCFEHTKFRCFVEPRNRELYGNMEFTNALAREMVDTASIDSPEKELGQNMHTGSGRLYLRFHGRNTDQWFRKGAGKLEKYNYLYSKPELESFSRIISPLATRGDEIFIYFNNHPSGNAPVNAVQMMDLFGLVPPQSKQNTLF